MSKSKIIKSQIITNIFTIVCIHLACILLARILEIPMKIWIGFQDLPFLRLFTLGIEILLISLVLNNPLNTVVAHRKRIIHLLVAIYSLFILVEFQNDIFPRFIGCGMGLLSGELDPFFQQEFANERIVRIIEISTLTIMAFIYTLKHIRK